VGGLLCRESALTLNGLDAGDIQLECPQLLETLDVAEALLEADAEELFGGFHLLALELVVTEVANLFDFHCLFLELLKSCLAAVLFGNDRRLNVVALDEAGLERKLVGCEAHGFLGKIRGDALHLEEDAAGTDDTNPMIGRSLTFT